MMKKTLNIICLSIMIVSMFACKNPQVKEQEKIKELNDIIIKNANPDIDKAQELINACLNYTETYDDSLRNPEYLFMAGSIQNKLKQYKEASQTFDKLIETYKDYIRRPEALFLAAMIYDKELKIIGKARHYYNLIIYEYPDCDYADDAKCSLPFLGVSMDRMNHEIIHKNDSIKTTPKDSIVQ